MRWKLTTSTVTGRAHTDRGETGQDYNKVGTIRIGDVEFFIGLAADGAGSTTEGGRGAEIACETVYEKIVATLRTAGGLSDITDENIRGWITAGRDAIDTEAAAKTKRLKGLCLHHPGRSCRGERCPLLPDRRRRDRYRLRAGVPDHLLARTGGIRKHDVFL